MASFQRGIWFCTLDGLSTSLTEYGRGARNLTDDAKPVRSAGPPSRIYAPTLIEVALRQPCKAPVVVDHSILGFETPVRVATEGFVEIMNCTIEVTFSVPFEAPFTPFLFCENLLLHDWRTSLNRSDTRANPKPGLGTIVAVEQENTTQYIGWLKSGLLPVSLNPIGTISGSVDGVA